MYQYVYCRPFSVVAISIGRISTEKINIEKIQALCVIQLKEYTNLWTSVQHFHSYCLILLFGKYVSFALLCLIILA